MQSAGLELAKTGIRVGGKSLLACSTAACCLWVLAIGALTANRAALSSQVTEGILRAAIDQRLQRLVVDRDQRPLGAGSLSLDAPSAASHVPDVCIDLVLWQEDRHHGSTWRRYAGIDLPALALAAIGQRGAGTLSMQIPRVALQLRTGHTTLERKRIELAAAADVARIYGDDMRAVARDYLLMAPFGVALNGGGGEIAGLVAFSAAAFGKSGSYLSTSECAIAVASLPMPPWFNDDGARSRSRHDLVATRAGALMRSAGLGSPEEIASVEAWRETFPIRGAETLPVIAHRELAPLLSLLNSEGQP
jgi:membrane carboxypeptidase/penicillin-binding protein PbpC